MKKRLLINWHDDGATIKVDNVSPFEFASALLAFASRDVDFGRALLIAAAKYEDLKKAGGMLKYIKKIKNE